jgi:hypothetical protein
MDWFKWTPRLLAILFTVLAFSLGFDAVEQGMSFWQGFAALALHLAPAALLAASTAVAWKRQKAGGALFVCYGLLYFLAAKRFDIFRFMVLSLIPFVAGMLFIMRGLIVRKI